MKQHKRFWSILLAICLIVSMLPAVFAAEEADQTDAPATITYNFGNHGANAGNALDKGAMILDTFEKTDGSWRYNSGWYGTAGGILFAYGEKGADGSGIQLNFGSTNASTAAKWEWRWIALEIKTPAAGTYDVSVDAIVGKGNDGMADIFVLPVEGTTLSEATNPALFVDANKLGTVDCMEGAEAVQTIGTWTVPENAADTCLLVFRHGGGPKQYARIGQLHLTPVQQEAPEETEDEIVYDFDIGAELNGGAGYVESHLADDLSNLEADYTAGKRNWKYEAISENLKDETGLPVSPDNQTVWVGFTEAHNFRVLSKEGDWIAFRIKAPAAGTYNLTLKHAAGHSCAKEGSVFILPGSTADIPAAMAAGTPVAKMNWYKDSSTVEPGESTALGQWTCPEAEELILVFRADKKQTFAYMVFEELVLSKVDMVEYAFYQTQYTVNGNSMAAHKAKIDEAYAAETSNWRYETASEGKLANSVAGTGTAADVMFNPTYGYRVLASKGEWIAFRIRVPKAGEFDLSLGHSMLANASRKTNVYLLPGQTTDVAAAIAAADPVGAVNFKGDANDGTEVITRFATWECAEAGEYIMVLEATEGRDDSSALAYMAFYRLLMQTASGEPIGPEEEEVTTGTLSLGEPIVTFGMNTFSASGEVNGHDYFYAPIKGGKLYVYDLDTKQKVDEEITDISSPSGTVIDSNGIVYLVGTNTFIFKYNPYTGIGEKINMPAGSAANNHQIAVDENDCLYYGSSTDGKLHKYDPKTGTFTDLGTPDADATYIMAVAYHDGYIYVNTYGDANGDKVDTKKLLKIDAATNQVVKTLDITDKMGSIKYLFNLCIMGGDTLIGGNGSLTQMIAVDLKTFQFIDIGIDSGCTVMVTEERNGKVYFVAKSKGLCEYDIATRKAKVVEGFETAGIGPRFTANSFVTIEGDPDLPGESILTNSASGPLVFYNLQTKKTVRWTDLKGNDGAGQWNRSFVNGPKGSNLIYIGAYHTGTAVGYNTAEEAYTVSYNTGNQTDSQILYNDKLYAGTYPYATVVEIDTTTYAKKDLFSLKDAFWQSRIHTLAAGDGKIFAGTVPDVGKYGGILAWYDMATGRTYAVVEADRVLYCNADDQKTWYDVKTNAAVDLDANDDGTTEFQFKGTVENQSIQSLVYKDGYIYGSTTKAGGSSASIEDCPAKEALIFVYDVNNMRMVGQYPVAIDGINNADFIAGIAADPDFANNGKLWGVVSETLFSFTFDKTAQTMAFKEEVSFSKTTYSIGGSRSWFPRPIVFGEDGYIYVGFDAVGGFRRISLTDPKKDNQRLMSDTPMFYVLGEDGNLYYALQYELRILPLNVTQEDWDAAAAVDAQISAIGDVTLESEEAIKAARSAYNALPNDRKALVTKLEVLEAAEVALAQLQYAANNKAAAEAVDAKITAIGEVKLESAAAIQEARQAYNALSGDQKALVTKLDVLVAAEEALKSLQAAADANAAAAVDAKIAAIGKVTLESKDAIAQARADYENLTAAQKALVSKLKNLEAAEDAYAELIKDATNPDTGDSVSVMLLTVMVLVSVVAMAALVIPKKNKIA